MPSKLKPIQHTMSLSIPLSGTVALQFATEYFIAERRGTILERSETGLRVKLGSRAYFRIWGLMPPAKKRLPMIIQVAVGAVGEGSVIHLEMTSDEGWYAARIPAVETAYMAQLNKIGQELEDFVILNGGTKAPDRWA